MTPSVPVHALEPSADDVRARRRLRVAALAAVVLPAGIAYNLPPTSTFFNQAAALGGWGLFVALAAWAAPPSWGRGARSAWPLLAVLGTVAALALGAGVTGVQPLSGVLAPLGALAAAAVVVATAAGGAASAAAVRAVLIALVVAGVASAAVAGVQVFAPAWADGTWIARSSLTGRAVGNLRQPNHLATLLLWACIALVPLVDAARSRRAGVAAALAWAVLVVAIELTGSRTGALGIALLAMWGLVDRRLGRAARALLLLAPLVYAASWAGADLAAQQGWGTFGSATRGEQADPSSSRFAIWRDTLALIAANPWTGVGFERFNLAWTLSPFPQRPVAYFDHAHNLPLQFAVEFGVPLALALTALLTLALARAARATWRHGDAPHRALLAMLVLVGVHSLLEYPLWYVHFLLPAAWAWGACMGVGREAPPHGPSRAGAVGVGVGAVMVLGAVAATADYLRVAHIFSPPRGAAPLAQRIADGQTSPLFAHHADYAAATVAKDPAAALPAFGRAAHHLIDARLLGAWARAWADAGDVERARYLAARLREFRRPEAQAFFAACDTPPADAATRPFQCTPPAAALTWRDFTR